MPCLGCSDNRTCDWREAAWQPDGCRHPSVDAARLRECMAGRKVNGRAPTPLPGFAVFAALGPHSWLIAFFMSAGGVRPQVLFLGDSTNRGMMYFLTERLNGSLAAWERSHGALLYRHVNGGRTPVAYSYYPRFWLERGRRPTFRQALMGLLRR